MNWERVWKSSLIIFYFSSAWAVFSIAETVSSSIYAGVITIAVALALWQYLKWIDFGGEPYEYFVTYFVIPSILFGIGGIVFALLSAHISFLISLVISVVAVVIVTFVILKHTKNGGFFNG